MQFCIMKENGKMAYSAFLTMNVIISHCVNRLKKWACFIVETFNYIGYFGFEQIVQCFTFNEHLR